MSVREKILAAMASREKKTAKLISTETGIDSTTVSKHLSEMVARGLAEHHPMNHGARRTYTLSGRAPTPRGAVSGFIRENPGCTLQQIIDGTNCRKQTAMEYTKGAVGRGRMTKKINDKGEYVYEFTAEKLTRFGCANPLTMIFNQRLQMARLNK